MNSIWNFDRNSKFQFYWHVKNLQNFRGNVRTRTYKRIRGKMIRRLGRRKKEDDGRASFLTFQPGWTLYYIVSFNFFIFQGSQDLEKECFLHFIRTFIRIQQFRIIIIMLCEWSTSPRRCLFPKNTYDE